MIDYDDVMQRLYDVGYEGWVIIEAEQDPANNRWNMRKSAITSCIRPCMMSAIIWPDVGRRKNQRPP